jgi:tetratricopeptide (TPR) repeat protein
MPAKGCAWFLRALLQAEAKTHFCLRSLLPLVLCLLCAKLSLSQTPPSNSPKKPSEQDILQQHYDAARTFQLSGDQDQAASEYRTFLAGALRSTARACVGLGQLDRSATLLDEALRIAPDDLDALLDLAQLRFQQDKLPDARALAEKVLKSSPDKARAQSLLGQILFAQGDYKAAREHLETAVVAAPGFDVAYLLGITYIKLGDFPRARLVFDDLVTGFGDTAQIHVLFGRAYKEGGWEALDKAIEELKKALAKDPRTPHAHFLIALAYMDRDGESGFPAAASELEAEVKANPDDARSHYLLGYIAMKQHDTKTAEAELLKSSQLDSKNPDPLIYLGQIYSDEDRDKEAEAMLRKAINLSANSSPNDYLIGRAHYVLGRLLLKTNRREEGEKELAASQTIRDRMNRPDAARDPKSKGDPELAGVSQSTSTGRPAGAPEVPPRVKEQMQDYMDQLKPAIADAYNNLGVIEAGRKDFAGAADSFRNAGDWNPSLETLDRNWGMAAFYADRFAEAISPLTHHLQKKPDDLRARAALALSLFSTQNFSGTIETLRPIPTEVDNDPGLSYAFAVSLVKVGEYEKGTARLKALEQSNPNSAEIHLLLGSAFADQREYDAALVEYHKALAIDPAQEQTHYLAGLALIQSGKPKDAIEEFRAALKLKPSDVAAKYHLAFSLVQAQQKDEAESLLREVIQQDPNRGDAYYELGKLQLEKGDTKSAVTSLETATKVSPESDYMHYQLAMAYRRESRSEDADRELKLYQTLKNRQRGRADAPQSD